ncbi:HTH-type transcriptional regulator CynR [compost metagenome]
MIYVTNFVKLIHSILLHIHPLFDRVGKITQITEAGRLLQHHVNNIFHELSQARIAINELQGLERGTLKIGALLSVVNYLLPQAVISFNERFPKIELSIYGLRTGDIYNGILQNELDIGIVYLPSAREEFESIPLRQESLVFAIPDQHPLAGESTLSLTILGQFPSVLFPENFHLRQLINEQCRNLGFKPNPIIEMTTLESILTMVGKGIGVTVLPQSYLQSVKDQSIRTIPLKEPSMSTEIGIVYRRNKHLCTSTRVFIDQLLASS